MTSSPDADATSDLPPALSSMWRLCKLGYRHEPGADARRRSCWRCSRRCPTRCSRSGSSCSARACSNTGRGCSYAAAIGLGVSATATWFLRTVSTRVQRRFRDKVTIALEVARRAAAGVDRDHRAPRAPRLSRSSLDAAQPGLRARPHVHVGLLDVRLDPAARRDDRPARVDSSGAACCSRSSRCRRC